MAGRTDISEKPISTAYRLLALIIRLLGLKKTFSLDEAGLDAYFKKTLDKRKTAPPAFMYRKTQVREWILDGRPCYIITPKKGASPSKTVLFFHGGGMIMEAHVIHWIVIAKLARRLEAAVWVPAYPLAPGHDFKEVTEMLFRVYGKMREEHPGSEFSILGDSAGGTLALMLCHHIKALGMPMPEKLILVSPGAFIRKDSRTIRDEMDRILPRDPFLSPKLMDVMIPLMGIDPDRGTYFDLPMEGDFSGFPETHVFFGTNEIFFALVPAFTGGMKAAGVPLKLYIGKGMMHIWPYMPVSRECREALKIIFEIIGGSPEQAEPGKTAACPPGGAGPFPETAPTS
ncbi:MAG: alpha/beta hydrolase [Treponema sp.]|nr:alpha/beta hydrolase [Treponema sp.]